MAELEQIHAIEYPKSKEQLALLLMRWNALKKAGISAQANVEMFYLTDILHNIGKQQRSYDERLEKLNKRRKTQAHPLQAQLTAFKLLTRGIDLPDSVQSEIFASSGIAAPSAEDNGRSDEEDESDADESYDNRLVLGTDVKPSASVGGTAEIVLRNRISNRVSELSQIAANLGTIDASQVSFSPPDQLDKSVDQLKIRSLVELKMLRLLTKQKSLRQHVVYNLAAQGNTTSQSVLARVINRSVKIPSPQDLQLTEHLERQQRLDRDQKERMTRLGLVRNAVSRAHQSIQEANSRALRHMALVRAIQSSHALIEREEARKAEKTAKQRLQALRANDEEAYIKLLHQTKDTRITHLLKQTNTFLASLSSAVKAQQAETGSALPTMDVPDEDDDKVDYYEVAHRVKEEVKEQPGILVGGQLKEYQLKGLQWMISLVNNNLNGILADEMGLGKTIQSISLLSYLIEVKQWRGPFLVIVPLSTITNWTVEFEKWAPSINKIVYKGPPNSRKLLQPAIRMGQFQVLLTTYEYIIKDRPLLSKIRWEHMIIDEGHRMKNAQSKLSSTLVHFYHSRHRLILTGTPLQNNLPELWALLNFVLPKIFNSVKTFDDWFNTPFAPTGGQDKMELTEEESLLIIRRLHKVLRPFLLRRLKKDVEKDLPDKVEKVVKCKMSALQAKLYEHMLKHNVLYTGAPADPKSTKMGIKGLNNRIMQLRKICNHPFVFEEVENLINPSHESNDQLWRTAGKFELLDRILPKFHATGHRVLMFFQMTQVMNIMEDYLRLRGMQYLRLDGHTKAEDRSDMLKLFNAPDSPYFCFLLSTRAGGLGLNLQTADTVIIYDTDWNPFQDLQAQDRAHRIGQTKEVRILRLITEDSVEEAILSRAISKLDIDGKVIQAGKFDNKSTAEEQEAFLRGLIEAEEARRDIKDDDDELDDDNLNAVLSRSEEEERIFAAMDEERQIATSSSKEPRLFSTEELPEVYKEDIAVHLEQPADPSGRRERRRVTYTDGLSEDQWIRTMEEEEDEMRGRRRSKRATSEPPNEPKRPKVDPMGPDQRESFRDFTLNLWDELMQPVAPTEPPRLRAAIFLELPSRKIYSDYYRIIRHPISLAEIRKRMDSDSYSTVQELRGDFDLMFANARTYNEEGSFVVEDANFLEGIVESHFEKYNAEFNLEDSYD